MPQNQQEDIQSVISASLEKVNEVLNSNNILKSFRRNSSNSAQRFHASTTLHQQPDDNFLIRNLALSPNDQNAESIKNVKVEEVEEVDIEMIAPRKDP